MQPSRFGAYGSHGSVGAFNFGYPPVAPSAFQEGQQHRIRLENRIAMLEAKLRDTINQSNELRDQLLNQTTRFDRTIQDLRTNEGVLYQVISKIKRQRETLRSENDTLSRQNAALEEQSIAFQNAHGGLSEQVTALQHQNATLQSENAGLEFHVKQLQDELWEIKREQKPKLGAPRSPLIVSSAMYDPYKRA